MTLCLAVFMGLFVFPAWAKAENIKLQIKASPVTPAAEIVWSEYLNGLAEGRKQKKPIFIDFYTDWCHWCHELDRVTYQDKQVIRLMNEKLIAIRINAESKTGMSIARQYPIRGYPSLWFLNSNGDVITPINGYVEPHNMVSILLYMGDHYFEQMNYDEFMKSIYPKLKVES